VTGGCLPAAAAADILVTGYDQNSWSEKTAPATATVEQVAVAWLKDLLRVPNEAAGTLCGGATIGNIVSLACARDKVLTHVGWDVDKDGLQGAPPVHLYVGAEGHSSVFKATRVVGLGGRDGRFTTLLPCDEDGAIQRDSVRHLEPPVPPAIVVLQAGHVNTGAFDDFVSLIAWAKSGPSGGSGIWVHVDGAFGLWAGVSAARRGLVEGVEMADSWATDLHKILNVPYDSGLVVIRDSACLYNSMSAVAPYLEGTNKKAMTTPLPPELQNSRRARGVVAYAALRSLGRSGVEKMVDGFCDLCAHLVDLVVTKGGQRAELLNVVCFNQALIRFADDDDLTRKIAMDVQESGLCWIAPTLYRGKVVIRLSVCCWKTDEKEIDQAASAILACAERALASTSSCPEH